MSTDYHLLTERLGARGIDVAQVEARLRTQEVETPSWAYGNSGTRFAVFAQPGVPRDPFEKLEDAAEVHRHTGVTPSVALHIPWDRVEDFGALREHANALGVRLGAINPNLFQDPEYKLGSVCHPDAAVRRRAVDHLLECVEIAEQAGSDVLSLWLADGTNYAGQDSFAARGRGSSRACRRSSRRCRRPSSCSSSTSCTSPRSTAPTSRTGARRSCSARRSASGRRSSSTSATTRRASTSSRSSPCCSAKAGWAASTSTTASTATTTSSSARSIRSSSSCVLRAGRRRGVRARGADDDRPVPQRRA